MNFVEVPSDVCKEGAEMKAEKVRGCRDSWLLGEKGKDVVIHPRSQGETGEGCEHGYEKAHLRGN